MTFTHRRPLVRCASIFAAAVLWAAGVASGQTASADNSSTPSGYSSSQAGLTQLASLSLPEAPTPTAAAMGGAAGGQYGNGKGYSAQSGGLLHRLTFEASGGANAPAGDKTYITWGGQFTVGGGLNINKYLAALIEYQFMDDKIPGAIIAEATAQAGHYHIWSFTIDPVFDLMPKATNDFYITGGGGFYRKVTTFTDVVGGYGCYFYFCGPTYYNQTVGHLSSNQGGFNIGGGYQHRMGGMYGDSRVRLFAEVRFVDVLSPAVLGQSANGLAPVSIAAGTKVLPINLGIRW